MITFLWPWAFLLLPLPWFAMRWLPERKEFQQALRLPTFAQLSEQRLTHTRSYQWHIGLLPAILVWSLLICALAQPLWLRDDQPIPVTGRDLMLLIDVSGSMRQIDFEQDGQPADRLSVVKNVATHFIEGRRGDRIGLILFGDKPYLRASPTYDHKAIIELTKESEIALAGESTAIGDAIGLAIKRMRHQPSESRVAILLTDGANNEGNIAPREAAKLAANEGIKIYTIGVGGTDTPAPNPYGIWSAGGAERFEKEVLEDVATLTQGYFFHVLDTKGLQEAYARLDQLEPSLTEDIYKYFATQLYIWPLGLALLLSLLQALYRHHRP